MNEAWLPPWRAIAQGEGTAFDAELAREVAPGHPLHGIPTMAVGRRTDCDTVLFACFTPEAPLAVVDLTWSGEPEPAPGWPVTRCFPSWQAWAEEGMRADHASPG